MRESEMAESAAPLLRCYAELLVWRGAAAGCAWRRVACAIGCVHAPLRGACVGLKLANAAEPATSNGSTANRMLADRDCC